jgi:polyisoprenyl-phosphate glycosyltransferase
MPRAIEDKIPPSMSEASVDGLRPQLSVVVPSYGCESCLRALHAEVAAALDGAGVGFELVLVDDHSPQGDWGVIVGLAAEDPRVRGVKLCRNFGQHRAITAGLHHARGDFVAVMDCDLQDRPDQLPALWRRAQEGVDCVFARRLDRTDGLAKRGTSSLFGRLHGALAGYRPDPAVGNFSIISARVVRELLRLHDNDPNYALQVHWLGFPTAYVDVPHAPRHSGKSTYTLARQLRHAAASLLSHSTRPLYASAALGLCMALGAVVAAGWLVVRKLTLASYVIEGWTSVIVSLFFLFGMLFLNLGIIGLYLGSVFEELKQRPTFVVERTTFDDSRERGAGSAGPSSSREGSGTLSGFPRT